MQTRVINKSNLAICHRCHSSYSLLQIHQAIMQHEINTICRIHDQTIVRQVSVKNQVICIRKLVRLELRTY